MLVYGECSLHLEKKPRTYGRCEPGNTVYVGLGVSGQPHSQPYRWVKSSTAIASFCLGCFFFSRASRFLGPLKRSTMVSSCIFQAVFCFAAVVMVVTGFVPKDAGDRLPHDFIVLLPLSLLSFQSAGQIVMSRFLGYVRSPSPPSSLGDFEALLTV